MIYWYHIYDTQLSSKYSPFAVTYPLQLEYSFWRHRLATLDEKVFIMENHSFYNSNAFLNVILQKEIFPENISISSYTNWHMSKFVFGKFSKCLQNVISQFWSTNAISMTDERERLHFTGMYCAEDILLSQNIWRLMCLYPIVKRFASLLIPGNASRFFDVFDLFAMLDGASLSSSPTVGHLT